MGTSATGLILKRRGRAGQARRGYVLAGLAWMMELASVSCQGGSSSPPLSPDFSIGLSTTSVSTQVGGTTAPLTVSVNPLNGFTGETQSAP